MSQKTVVRRVCDLHHDRDGFEIPLTVGVHTYTPDLCHGCQEQLLAAVEPFVRAAVPQPDARGRRTMRPPRTVPALVREWGAANGIEVPAKGRIKREIEDQYLAAHA